MKKKDIWKQLLKREIKYVSIYYYDKSSGSNKITYSSIFVKDQSENNLDISMNDGAEMLQIEIIVPTEAVCTNRKMVINIKCLKLDHLAKTRIKLWS